SKLQSECALASGGVLPPQEICATPFCVSTWHFTAQFFSAVSPLSVTMSILAPSGEMTQVARDGVARHAISSAAAAKQAIENRIESPRKAFSALVARRPRKVQRSAGCDRARPSRSAETQLAAYSALGARPRPHSLSGPGRPVSLFLIPR